MVFNLGLELFPGIYSHIIQVFFLSYQPYEGSINERKRTG